MTLIDFLTLLSDTALAISVAGLIFVAGGFLALIGINIFERLRGRKLGRPLRHLILTDADLPHVLVQIPVFNEPETVIGALRSASALDWPRDRLHIQLLDDSFDETSAIAARVIGELLDRGFNVEHLRRGDRSGYKAGALAAGLAHSSAPYIAVLDVDFRPPANWLRKIMPALIADPKASFIQSRCEFANASSNWLTRAQGLMLDAHYVLEQATRYRAGWLFQFNGTAGVWRRTAINAAGGWSSDSLCEDLDLTVRAEIAGWHGLFSMDPPVPGLVPDKVKHWRVQQRRWSNGFVQVARKLLKQVWTSDWTLRRKASALLLILVQTFYPCAAVALGALTASIFLRAGDTTAYLPVINVIGVLIAMVAIGMTLTPYILLQRGSATRYVATLASLTPLMIFVSLSNAPSILKTVFGAADTWTRTPKALTVPLATPGDPLGRF
ncbi:glycosyltransferase family 2 protein [Methylocella silvestris]|uniref:Glycosyl transferase n=1 Tax=Methylocella silvestris TaxID=199596 RepID=A0A2J7TGL9_METSI|nr:glycosyltransferase family 2 protein [Methylocella silvestris]PNG25910.1 glycosyl transferase [Methylocella silvestris]